MSQLLVVGVVVVAALMVGLADSFPQQPAASSPSAGNGVLGSTYDEIVVETQLAVRPKAASAGLRLGRAKPVFFRPNATTSGSSGSSTTTTTTSTTTAPGDTASFAARVVGVENPLAAAKARAQRGRRDSSSSSSSSYHSSYFRSSSSGSSSSSGGGAPEGSGRTVSVSAADEFVQGPQGPSSSSLRAVFVSGQ